MVPTGTSCEDLQQHSTVDPVLIWYRLRQKTEPEKTTEDAKAKDEGWVERLCPNVQIFYRICSKVSFT